MEITRIGATGLGDRDITDVWPICKQSNLDSPGNIIFLRYLPSRRFTSPFLLSFSSDRSLCSLSRKRDSSGCNRVYFYATSNCRHQNRKRVPRECWTQFPYADNDYWQCDFLLIFNTKPFILWCEALYCIVVKCLFKKIFFEDIWWIAPHKLRRFLSISKFCFL